MFITNVIVVPTFLKFLFDVFIFPHRTWKLLVKVVTFNIGHVTTEVSIKPLGIDWGTTIGNRSKVHLDAMVDGEEDSSCPVVVALRFVRVPVAKHVIMPSGEAVGYVAVGAE